jgi:putative methionine-R-sulfoxide reductase with GAF domain
MAGEGMPLDGRGIIVRAINTRKTCNVPDTREDPDYVRYSEDETLFTMSEIAVPILAHGKSIGVVNIEDAESHAFDESDQEILKALAGYAGFALGRIRYSNRLSGLHRHASQLSRLTSVGEVAEYTLDAMTNTLELETCGFLLAQNGEFQPILEKGLDESIRLREKTVERIKSPDRLREVDKFDFLSELEAEIIVDDEVVAILSAKSIQPDAYTEQDNVLLETLASHVESTLDRINHAKVVKQLAYKLNNLQPGGCYLSESHERCLKAYAVLSMEGVPGLCIVREDPQRLVDNYGIKKEEIVLLSSRPFDDYETLDDLQSVSRRLTRFLESGEGVVLLDGLEYLISRFGFDAVYSFIQEKRFDFLRSKAVLLVPLNMETIESREKALLSSEFIMLE